MVVNVGNDCGSQIVDHPLGKLPAFFEDFAHRIHVHIDTLHEWRKVHPEFNEYYRRAQQVQLVQLIEGGLAGTYRETILAIYLKNRHGFTEPIEHGGTLTVNVVDGLRQVLARSRQRQTSPTTTPNTGYATTPDLGHANGHPTV